MDDLPTHLFDADVIAIDLETRDPNIKRGAGWARRDGYIVGVALGSAAGSHYLPIRHEGGGNMDPDRVLEFVADLCSTQIPKVMHNSMYDRGWLKAEGVDIRGRVYDTMFAAALLDENRFSYSLDNVAVDWCGIGKDETELNEAVAQAFGKKAKPKENLWRLPGDLVRRYAEADVEATLGLWSYEEPLLRQEGLWKLFELECDLVPLLLEMRMRGIRVDLDKAEQTGKRLKEMEDAVHADIYRQWGVRVDVWAAASVARAADAVGLPYPRTPKTKAPSFSKEWLAAHQHPLMQAILRLRRLEKTRGTFVTNMILEHQVNGRIHCELHPLRSDDGGTVSGRFCVSGDTILETSVGDIRIDEFNPTGNEYVKTHLGNWKKVLRRIYKGRELMYSVYLTGGQKITCTANHRMLTNSGWKSLKDMSGNEEIRVYGTEQRTVSRQSHTESRNTRVHFGTVSDSEGPWKESWSFISYGGSNRKRYADGRRVSTTEVTSVLQGEGGGPESHEGKERFSTSQLQGGSYLRREGIPDQEDRRKIPSDASSDDVRGVGYSEDTGGICSSSHRRRRSEFFPGQLGVSNVAWASSHARTESIEEIVLVGEKDVWDIEVEDDHSYLAGGIYHHNSCANPNLQQVSARDPELGPMVRGLFLPEPGCLWGAYDYSSQEPRLTVHFAAETNQAGAAEAVAGYRADERMDYHQMVADMANISRKHAKVVNLGLAYGLGGVKLCKSLGYNTEFKNGREVPGEEALDLLQRYHASVPFVKGLSSLASRLAEQRGWIRTLGGRLCRFDKFEPIRKPPGWEFEALKQRDAIAKYGKGNIKRSFTHKALNRLIQGSAADMTKMAMLNLWNEGLVPMHQMHDELDFSVSDPAVAKRISEIMRDCVDIQVPVVVDAEFGETWGDATKEFSHYWP